MKKPKNERYALIELEHAPNGFACEGKIGRAFCRNEAWVAYRETPESPRTYKCAECAPGVPDLYRTYDVYFDWSPSGKRNGERRVVTGIIARCEAEALMLYRAFVDRSKLVEAPVRTKIADERWNESVMLIDESADEDQFLDMVRRACDGDSNLRRSFEDILNVQPACMA